MSVARSLTRFTRKEVSTTFGNARPLERGRAFDLFVAPGTTPIGRILVMTPRKVGSAPTRNLLKRRIRSIFYEEKFYEYPIDAIITVKRAARDLSFFDLKKLLLNAFTPSRLKLSQKH